MVVIFSGNFLAKFFHVIFANPTNIIPRLWSEKSTRIEVTTSSITLRTFPLEINTRVRGVEKYFPRHGRASFMPGRMINRVLFALFTARGNFSKRAEIIFNLISFFQLVFVRDTLSSANSAKLKLQFQRQRRDSGPLDCIKLRDLAPLENSQLLEKRRHT